MTAKLERRRSGAQGSAVSRAPALGKLGPPPVNVPLVLCWGRAMSEERPWPEGRGGRGGVRLQALAVSEGLNCTDKSQGQEEDADQQSRGCRDRPRGWPLTGREKM